jgi:hypothetical protein
VLGTEEAANGGPTDRSIRRGNVIGASVRYPVRERQAAMKCVRSLETATTILTSAGFRVVRYFLGARLRVKGGGDDPFDGASGRPNNRTHLVLAAVGSCGPGADIAAWAGCAQEKRFPFGPDRDRLRRRTDHSMRRLVDGTVRPPIARLVVGAT